MKERNRLRTSCAATVGRGDFKKQEAEDGAVQPIATERYAKCLTPRQ